MPFPEEIIPALPTAPPPSKNVYMEPINQIVHYVTTRPTRITSYQTRLEWPRNIVSCIYGGHLLKYKL